MKSNFKQTYLIHVVAFIILFLLFGLANGRLFYRQAHCDEYKVGNSARYQSDIPDYIDVVKGVDTEFEFSYPVLFDLSRFLVNVSDMSPENAVALVVLILNMLCILVLTAFMWKCVGANDKWIYKAGAIVLPYVMLLVSMIWLPGDNNSYGLEYRYLGVFTPNPWHNQTYLASRPFAIIAFIIFTKIIGYYEERVDIKDYLIFSIALLVATMTKPSFTLVFGSVTLLFLIVRLVMHRFKTLEKTIMLGLCFLPTVAGLIIQYMSTFSDNASEAEEGIGFSFLTVWSLFSSNVPLSLLLALAFPIVVLVFNLKDFVRNRAYRFAWEFLLAGTLEFMFLTEEGIRLGHANFSWGYMYGLFFIFVMSIWLLFKNTIDRKNNVIALVLEWGTLLMHFIAGNIYFVYLLNGGDFTQF